ncbi:uncharacterized protein [Ambystoma mexicanum]|uniref:uncharacterized protein n=1 Tax=Ambystoma mexicanum TaxID=8296 RepID=UPI0037E8FC83
MAPTSPTEDDISRRLRSSKVSQELGEKQDHHDPKEVIKQKAGKVPAPPPPESATGGNNLDLPSSQPHRSPSSLIPMRPSAKEPPHSERLLPASVADGFLFVCGRNLTVAWDKEAELIDRKSEPATVALSPLHHQSGAVPSRSTASASDTQLESAVGQTRQASQGRGTARPSEISDEGSSKHLFSPGVRFHATIRDPCVGEKMSPQMTLASKESEHLVQIHCDGTISQNPSKCTKFTKQRAPPSSNIRNESGSTDSGGELSPQNRRSPDDSVFETSAKEKQSPVLLSQAEPLISSPTSAAEAPCQPLAIAPLVPHQAEILLPKENAKSKLKQKKTGAGKPRKLQQKFQRPTKGLSAPLLSSSLKEYFIRQHKRKLDQDPELSDAKILEAINESSLFAQNESTKAKCFCPRVTSTSTAVDQTDVTAGVKRRFKSRSVQFGHSWTIGQAGENSPSASDRAPK